MKAISAFLDWIASTGERFVPNRPANIAMLLLLIVAIALLMYAANTVKLARWL